MQNNKTYSDSSVTYYNNICGSSFESFPYMNKIYEELTSTTNKSHFVMMPRQMGKSTLLARLAKHKHYCGKKVVIFCPDYISVDHIKKLLGEDRNYIKVLSGTEWPHGIRSYGIDVALFDDSEKLPRDMISNLSQHNNIKSQWFGFGTKIPWQYYNKFEGLSSVEWWEIPRYKDGKFDPRGWRDEQIRLLGKIHFDREFGYEDPYG